MALKMAIYLCIGGNDFIPKFYQITHKNFVERILMSENVRSGPGSGLIQITMGDEQDCRRCRIQINKELYKELIKEIYCPKYLYPSQFSFDEVRQMSVQLPQKSGSNEYRDARNWVPPASAIEKMCELLQCYVNMLTAGTTNAAAPDVSMCFISTESKVQYDLGPETYVSSPKLILTHTPSELVEKMAQNRTVRKRSAPRTPEKNDSKKRKPRMSTPKKLSCPSSNDN